MIDDTPRIVTGKAAQDVTTSGIVNGLLGGWTLFDRVINVKITYKKFVVTPTGKKYIGLPNELIIRSDYEHAGPYSGRYVSVLQSDKTISAAMDAQGLPHWKKVQVKPDIRVIYKGYGSVGLKFSVVIGNLFPYINDTLTATELNNRKLGTIGMEMDTIEILMGYMTDFPDFTKTPPVIAKTVNDFKNPMYAKASYLKGSILYWYRSSAPPDGAYTFYCEVADLSSPAATLISVTNSLTPVDSSITTARETSMNSYILSHGSNFPSMVEWYISRHYVRSESLLTSPLTPDTYELSDIDAAMNGISVFVESPTLMGNTDLGKTNNFNYVNHYIPLEANAVAMLAALKRNFWPTLDFRFGLDGNVYLFDKTSYTPSEAEQRVLQADMGVWNMVRRSLAKGQIGRDFRPVQTSAGVAVSLPAVYNVQYGALTIIECPMIGVLAPGQNVTFNARYSVAQSMEMSMVVSPPGGEVMYAVLYYDLDFSTVGEYNTMRLTCISDTI